MSDDQEGIDVFIGFKDADWGLELVETDFDGDPESVACNSDEDGECEWLGSDDESPEEYRQRVARRVSEVNDGISGFGEALEKVAPMNPARLRNWINFVGKTVRKELGSDATDAFEKGGVQGLRDWAIKFGKATQDKAEEIINFGIIHKPYPAVVFLNLL